MRTRYAEMWSCGDDECDCCQPKVVEHSTGHFRDWGWKPEQTIEEGDFKSGPDSDEYDAQCLWLLSAARRHKVANLAEIEEAYGWIELKRFNAEVLDIVARQRSSLE